MTTTTIASAITAFAYAEFIQKVVATRGGRITECELNALIEEKYRPHWTETDLQPWGQQHHPKWKQNVASAKSALDRRGIVVKYKAGRIVWRVALPEAFLVNAVLQWAHRGRGIKKRTYEPLAQPTGRHVVPQVS